MLELILLAGLSFVPLDLAIGAETTRAGGTLDVRESWSSRGFDRDAGHDASIWTLPCLCAAHESLERLPMKLLMEVSRQEVESVEPPVHVVVVSSVIAAIPDAVEALDATVSEAGDDVRCDAVNAHPLFNVPLRSDMIVAIMRHGIVGVNISSRWLECSANITCCVSSADT